MGNWTPSIVPDGRSQTVYLVVNGFGRLGRLETGEDEAELETIITGMLEGQYSNLVMSLPSIRPRNGPETYRNMSPTRSAIVAIDKGPTSRRTSKHSWTVTKTETSGSSRCASCEAASQEVEP
jgi:hypothetical protein